MITEKGNVVQDHAKARLNLRYARLEGKDRRPLFVRANQTDTHSQYPYSAGRVVLRDRFPIRNTQSNSMFSDDEAISLLNTTRYMGIGYGSLNHPGKARGSSAVRH